MKRILAATVLLVSFCVLVNTVRAESNPLLTIFEGLETTHSSSGIIGTPINVVIMAAGTYSKVTKFGPGVFDSEISWRQDKANSDGTRVLTLDWTDEEFAREYYDGGRINPPTATLEITTKAGVVIRAKYTYYFLDLRKSLYK